MNIQKLLKKLDKNSIDNKRQIFTAQGVYNLKTSQSVGTLNSILDQNERSFVISNANTPLNNNKKDRSQGPSANSKLDDQLTNIQKMKNLYQSRQQRKIGRTKSIQRGSASGQKSLQKHLLKPSNTPSFSKIQSIKVLQKNNDSACKNLYTEKMLTNSQISQKQKKNNIYLKQAQKQNVYQYPESSLHIEDYNDNQPYEEEPSYNEQSISQIANISEDMAHETKLQKIADHSDQNWKVNHKNSQINQTNCHSQPSYRQKIVSSNSKEERCNSCISKEQISFMMANFQSKIEGLAEKIRQLEQENATIKGHQKQLQQKNNKYLMALEYQNDEKEKMMLELKKQQEQKQELEMLLKDVLYKRQREKLQNSKENTCRENQRNEKKINFSFAHSQSTSDFKQPRNSMNAMNAMNTMNSQARQSESKMKVQNLLNKLQIRVDRV